MPGAASFYFAMFKKFQAICGIFIAPGHVNDDSASASTLYGGFSLQSTQDPFGIFGHLGPQSTTYQLSPAMTPLTAGSLVPADNPLWVMLNASLAAPPVPATVVVNGQTWPVMPPPNGARAAAFPLWLSFNATAPRLIDALGDWITQGKLDDSPKNAPISFTAVSQSTPVHWPQAPNADTAILFVASFAGDDGRRHGDHSMPDPAANRVPADFWATSQIYLTDETGLTVQPAALPAGQEYYVVALIGNAGRAATGATVLFGTPQCQIQGDAQAFNTFTSPGLSLPSLDNLDPTAGNAVYEILAMKGWTYDVAGFRFNVDAVFSGLAAALGNQVPAAMLGGLTPADWLKAGHPCVKIRIMSGENANIYLPAGATTAAPPTLDSLPAVDRHIGQRNLAPFDMALMGIRKPVWTNFIVAQAGTGWNELTLRHALPAEAFRFHFAIPRLAWERWIDPKTSKGGAMRGLEVVTDVPSKPFPDAVILRQTGPALLRIADHGHAKERFFGMSLGIEGDPAELMRARNGGVSVVHAAREGVVVGGFTLQAPAGRAKG